LIPAVVVALFLIWAGSFALAEFAHECLYYGQSLRTARGVGPVLATVGPFFGALPLAMLIGNYLIHLIPPARQALDSEASAYRGTSYRPAQAGLIKMAAPLVLLSVAVTVFGTFCNG
jgi:hypothetical protein